MTVVDYIRWGFAWLFRVLAYPFMWALYFSPIGLFVFGVFWWMSEAGLWLFFSIVLGMLLPLNVLLGFHHWYKYGTESDFLVFLIMLVACAVGGFGFLRLANWLSPFDDFF